MSSLVDRLRGALSPGRLQPPGADGTRTDGTTPPAPGSAPMGGQPYAAAGTVRAALDPSAIAEALGGEWREARPHPWLVVERKYGAGHRHGRIATCDSMPPESGVWPGLSILTGGQALTGASGDGGRGGRLLFLDLETTGLAGGAGTYAFLVGLGWFEGATFRIRQYFLSSFGAEKALLEEVATLADDCAGLVTFNGRTFDVPLIETRFALHRLRPPFGELPHVDMLHAARRLWRPPADGDYDDGPGGSGRSGGPAEREAPRGCRLSELEQVICGHEREGDVPGFEIPGRYFNFVRSGDARPLEPVFEHNRLDLLSLAHLTARAAQLAIDGPSSAADAREALGIGALYERAGRVAEASAAYARAAGLAMDGGALAGDSTTRAEALRAFALLARRERKYDDAADAWSRALQLRRCPPPIAREAAEALAVHHEHRLRDLEQARAFALQSLQYRGTASRTVAVQHRLKRLDRKLGRPDALDFQ